MVVGAIVGVCFLGGSTFATLSAGLASSIEGFSPFVEKLLVFLSWLLFFVPLVPTVMVFALILRLPKKLSFGWILCLSLLWVSLEYVRMIIFNVATFAPYINNPPFFSAGFLGYLLADNESFLQLAALGGVPLMSFVVMVANLGMYQMMMVEKRTQKFIIPAWVIFLSSVAFLPLADIRESLDSQRSWKEVSVGVMSLHATSTKEYEETVVLALSELETQAPDIIVLPEGVSYSQLVLENSEEIGTAHVVGSRFSQVGGVGAHVAEVGRVGTDEHEVVRGKGVLAAQGEYIIGLFSFVARHLGLSQELRNFSAYGNLSTMRWGESFSVGSTGVRASVAFCVEMLQPFLGARLVQEEHSGLLVFLLAHNQFTDAYTLQTDTQRFLKVRAVEAGVPLTASARASHAYVFDAYGRTLGSFGSDGDAWGVVRVDALSTEALIQETLSGLK